VVAADFLDSDSGTRLGEVVAALTHVLASRPAGLLADVDGTISRMTRRPMDATVALEARETLRRLAASLDVVSVVTGRAVRRAQLMVGVAEIGYVGNHGLEWLHDGQVVTHPGAVAARPALDAALRAVRAWVFDPGLVIEDKGASVAIHYRLSTRPEAAEKGVLAALGPYITSGALHLIQGGLVINLLPGIAVNKGEAVLRLADEHGLRGVAFFGDDITDLDAFRALRTLRERDGTRTLSVGVLSADGPPQVRDEADLLLDGVDEVEQVLAALAASLSE
jgi:trehalose 6-phosphate phosphatase